MLSSAEGPTCKHQAATLYAAIELIRYQPIDKNEKTKKRATPNIIPPPPPSNKLEGMHAGEFRRLPITETLAIALKKYQPKQYSSLTWNESFEGHFISENEIELETVSTQFYYRHNDKKKIRLILEDGEFFVKCLVCTSPEKKLCAHQMAILIAAKDILDTVDYQSSDFYNQVLLKGASKLGFSTEVIKKYFIPKISYTGFSFTPKEDNMVNEKWIKETQKLSQRAKGNRQDIIKKRNGITQR